MCPGSSCDPNSSDLVQSECSCRKVWLKSPNIAFPGELLALAYSAQGQALLEGFNFFRIQNAAAMPDHVPLFGLELETREQFVSLLKARGLDVE
jgi:hypothetical protein